MVVAKLRNALRRALESADVRERLERMGFEPRSAGGFAAHVAAEIERLRTLVKQTGIQVQVQ